jgi:hypothetical protein
MRWIALGAVAGLVLAVGTFVIRRRIHRPRPVLEIG